ncbi:MAG: superoxide dismutase [Bacteroidota bacterium]|nr:superoxide dismutase [Bacteroidota bacterium]
MSFELPKLPYEYNALEPHIDARTMEIHHSKHHNGYTTNLNNAIAGTNLEGRSIEEICSTKELTAAVRNNGGGYFNHNLFWTSMSPDGGGNPIGEINDAINNSFGSFDNFKSEFSKAASTRFGSGWAWLCVENDRLTICSTANQDNPLMDGQCGGTPILCLDVWEHAYYLNYQNRRPDYITAFFNVINWNEVNSRYNAAL